MNKSKNPPYSSLSPINKQKFPKYTNPSATKSPATSNRFNSRSKSNNKHKPQNTITKTNSYTKPNTHNHISQFSQNTSSNFKQQANKKFPDDRIFSITKQLENTYYQMIRNQKKSLKWKRSFIFVLTVSKAIDLNIITNENILPKSINQIGSIMFKNYKFWILYIEYIQKYLSLSKLINLIVIAILNMGNKKDIRSLQLFFAAKIEELRISNIEIQNYCLMNNIKINKANKHYEYLLKAPNNDYNANNNCNIKIINASNIQNQNNEEEIQIKKESSRHSTEEKNNNDNNNNENDNDNCNQSCNNSFIKEDNISPMKNNIMNDNLKASSELFPNKNDSKQKDNNVHTFKLFDHSQLNEEIAKFKLIFQNEENDSIKYNDGNLFSNVSHKQQNPLLQFTSYQKDLSDEKSINSNCNYNVEISQFHGDNNIIDDDLIENENNQIEEKQELEDSYFNYLTKIVDNRKNDKDNDNVNDDNIKETPYFGNIFPHIISLPLSTNPNNKNKNISLHSVSGNSDAPNDNFYYYSKINLSKLTKRKINISN